MGRALLVVIPIVVLAGCKAEDNSPDRHERQAALRDCVGELVVANAPEELRLACFEIIYGGQDR